jgi:hypothetical protein
VRPKSKIIEGEKMSFKKILSDIFSPLTKSSEGYSYWFSVKCRRCGEKIRARVDMRNDLSINYGDGRGKPTYFCRKVIIGEQKCFQKIELEFTFDHNRRLIERQIYGGEFIEEK